MSAEKEEPPRNIVVQVKRPRRLGIDLTLAPADWLPDARNARVEFTARIYEFRNGKWEYPGEPRSITFSFKEVSKEWGVCTNYPVRDRKNTKPASALESNDNPDLFFAEDDDRAKDLELDEDKTDSASHRRCPTQILAANDNPSHKHHYLKASTKKPVTEAKVAIRCEDYGAFGVLTASAPDCETIKPREKDAECSQQLTDNDVKIPRDDNGNNIADAAGQDKLDDGSKTAPEKDEDDVPHSTDHKGDGLTNYEEYRGFIVKEGGNKRHRRTSIKNKDVFIYDVNSITTGYFNASGLTRHLIFGPEYYNGNSEHDNDSPPTPADRQLINCNRTSHTGGAQHGLRLVNKDMTAEGSLGYTYGGNVPLLPKDTNYVSVDRAKLVTMVAGRLQKTIAHELGHSVHVIHHGEESDCPDCGCDLQGHLTSGNVLCVMRYGPNYDTEWCHKHGGACHPHNIPDPEVVATQFCDSKNATGCNVAGAPCNAKNDATQGNCKDQIKVKDW